MLTRISAPWWATVALTVLLVLASLFGGTFWAHIAILAFMWAAAASAWNIVGGFAGQTSLGHAAFFGVGAYTSTLLYVHFGISPWLGMLAGMVLGALLATLVGLPTLRLRGTYFSLGTFALGTTMMLVAIQWRDLTKGGEGLSVPFNEGLLNFSFLSKTPYVLIALLFMAISAGVAELIARSKLGYQLAAIRDDQEAARALGIDVTRAKLIAAAISGGLTAMCGTFYAQYIYYINPASVFGSNTSFQPLLLTIIGGIGTVYGPLLGALTIVPLTQLILGSLGGEAAGLHTLVFGVALVVIVLFAPAGLGQAAANVRSLLASRLMGRGQVKPAQPAEQKGVK